MTSFIVVRGRESNCAHKCKGCANYVHAISAEKKTTSKSEGYGRLVLCVFCSNKRSMISNKNNAVKGLSLHAEEMKKLYNEKFPTLTVGASVIISILSVGRSKGDARRNLTGIVTESTKDNETYSLRSVNNRDYRFGG